MQIFHKFLIRIGKLPNNHIIMIITHVIVVEQNIKIITSVIDIH